MPGRLVLIAAALGAAGCAGPSAQETAFGAGWRVAVVVTIGPAAPITEDDLSRDCRKEPPAPAPDAIIAALRYKIGSRHYHIAAPPPPQSRPVPASGRVTWCT